MWFKQAHTFALSHAIQYDAEQLSTCLEPLMFQPCLASLPMGAGFIPPMAHEEAPLVYAANGYLLLCVQIEEKVLPTTVVKQHVNEKIQHIESIEDRKVYSREKRQLGEEITQQLLPRAFSKLSRIHVLIDTKHQRFIIDNNQTKKIELVFDLLKRSLPEFRYKTLTLKKIPPILTRWILDQQYPNTLHIEKACVLKDPRQQSRIIRCHNQELSAQAIASLLKDGCEVHQLAMSWRDQVHFVLHDQLGITGIRYADELIETAKEQSETLEQQWAAHFILMTDTLHHLLEELFTVFTVPCFDIKTP